MGTATGICVFATLLALASANTAGTLFQLAFMDNKVEAPQDGPLEVHVSNTGTQTATVSLTMPNSNCESAATRTVGPDSSIQFTVCWWMRLTKDDLWPVYKTIIIESDRPVMVYGYNKELYSADGFYAIPVDELAFSYVLASYDEANIATQFAISATADCTVQVEIPGFDGSLPVLVNYRGVVYSNGDKFTMSLAQYETVLGTSQGDLTGARVIADQPIAVWSGNVRNKQDSGSRDHLVAMLQPTGDWGTQFSLAPVVRTQNFGDVVRVIARRANTQFTITFSGGNTVSQTLSAPGQYYEFTMSGSCSIESSNSGRELQVIQMVRSQAAPRIADVADPVMFLLVPRNQWLNEYVSPRLVYQRDGNQYAKNFVYFAIANGQQSGLRINGNTFIASWTVIDGVASAWLDLNTLGVGSSNRYSHVSNQNFMALVYGASDRESYGFALGADLSNSGCQESLMMRGDGEDNDCDGQSDEETCNQVDDDSDGLVDEDCAASSTEAFGRDYVIVFMENNVNDNPSAQSFLEIYLSAVDRTANVPYTLTRLGQTFTGTITAGEVEIFTDLPLQLRQTGSGINNDKAIIIAAEQDVVVYGINKQTWSTDGFLAFPNDVVGTEYYTSHYHPGTDLNEFVITPVVNDGSPTRVTVRMPSNLDAGGNVASTANFGSQTITAGQSYTFDLSYGETAQFQAASDNDNLNGAYITTTKPVSVFSGNVRARVDPTTAQSRDHLVAQLSPVATWGLTFVTLPAPRLDDRGDIFFITASQDSTTVSIEIKNTDGTSSTSTQNIAAAGNYISVTIGSEQYAYIQASRPVQVYQYVKTTANRLTDNADPAMMTVPPVEQWSRNYQFSTPRTGQDDGSGGLVPFTIFIMIAIDRTQTGGLRLDGSTLNNPQWTQLTGNFAATVIEVPFGRHSLTHIDPNVYFEALMYGRADRESVALPLGMRLVVQGCTVTTQVQGDQVDNDCDGSVDEELCNNIDDDADGAIDEDCGAGLSSGTAFYLTYMDNVVEYPRDFDLELYVAVVGSSAAIVTVRTPLYSSPEYNIMTEVQPGQVQQYGFTWRMRNTGQGITGNTVYVRANSQVVVYGVNKELFSNDGFLVYPESSLGTNYYTCSWAPSTLATEFAVVATQDNTDVTVTLPSQRANIAVVANNQTYTSGASFVITLQRFQTFQAQSQGDLSGTRIQSSQRTAVFSGNVRTLIELSGSRDHLVQQMVPTGSYGSTFYVVPFPERTVGDVLKITAGTGNTQVRVNGNLVATISQIGGFTTYPLDSSSPVVITTNNPVMIIQFVKSQNGRDNPEEADPAMFVVPSNNNFVTTGTFVTPIYSGGNTPGSDYTNFLTLVIINGQQGNLRLNGSPLTQASWTSIGSSSYVTATVLAPSGQSHTITTTSGASFYGRLYGRADRESYAFPIGFQF